MSPVDRADRDLREALILAGSLPHLLKGAPPTVRHDVRCITDAVVARIAQARDTLRQPVEDP